MCDEWVFALADEDLSVCTFVWNFGGDALSAATAAGRQEVLGQTHDHSPSHTHIWDICCCPEYDHWEITRICVYVYCRCRCIYCVLYEGTNEEVWLPMRLPYQRWSYCINISFAFSFLNSYYFYIISRDEMTLSLLNVSTMLKKTLRFTNHF